jgi:hypothetical protein
MSFIKAKVAVFELSLKIRPALPETEKSVKSD